MMFNLYNLCILSLALFTLASPLPAHAPEVAIHERRWSLGSLFLRPLQALEGAVGKAEGGGSSQAKAKSVAAIPTSTILPRATTSSAFTSTTPPAPYITPAFYVWDGTTYPNANEPVAAEMWKSHGR